MSNTLYSSEEYDRELIRRWEAHEPMRAEIDRLRQRIAELEDPHYVKGLQAEIERLRDDCVAHQGLAYEWMKKHDKLLALIQRCGVSSGRCPVHRLRARWALTRPLSTL